MLSRRTLALDIGTVRIGVAVSDPLGMFAQGIAVLAAESAWMEELDALVKTYDPETLLLGVPLRTAGKALQRRVLRPAAQRRVRQQNARKLRRNAKRTAKKRKKNLPNRRRMMYNS